MIKKSAAHSKYGHLSQQANPRYLSLNLSSSLRGIADKMSSNDSEGISSAEDSIPRQRRTRKDCLLSEGERLAILPFKERYRAEANRKRRIALVKNEIMSAYFSYLHTQNQTPKTRHELKTKTKVSLFGFP
jgi:hypothetical protein